MCLRITNVNTHIAVNGPFGDMKNIRRASNVGLEQLAFTTIQQTKKFSIINPVCLSANLVRKTEIVSMTPKAEWPIEYVSDLSLHFSAHFRKY